MRKILRLIPVIKVSTVTLIMTGQIAALTLPDPYLISRVLSRQEALSSSLLEGTHSTPNELPVVAENDQNASHPDRTDRLCP